MIVVAIIGILAAVAIPGFMQYIKSSKTSEAKTNLNALSKGAVAYFEAEHYSDDGMSATSKQYPSAQTTPAIVGKPASAETVGQKVNPLTELTIDGTTAMYTGNNETSAKLFQKLNFEIKSPIYYFYYYIADGYTPASDSATAKYEKSHFGASATASLSENSDSMFCLKGTSQGQITALIEGKGSGLCGTANTAEKATD